MEIFLGVLFAIFILYLAYSLVSNKIEDSFESKLRDRENQTKKEYDKKIEEADMFAARLLCPSCVLWGLNLHTADEIARTCECRIVQHRTVPSA